MMRCGITYRALSLPGRRLNQLLAAYPALQVLLYRQLFKFSER